MAWRNGKRTVRCYKCYGVGHNRRNCPDNTPEDKARYATGDNARKCSWCGEAGHNKTSCKTRREQQAAYIAENAQHRKEVLAYMQDNGYGIGALITESRGEAAGAPPPMLYMVTDIAWDKVQKKDLSNRILVARSLNQDYDYSFSLPINTGDKYRYHWYDAAVVSRCKAEYIEPPAGWLNGSSGIEKYFK